MATPDEGRRRTWRFRLNDRETLEVSTPPRATEKQVRRRGRILLLLAALVTALAVAMPIALADNTQVDGDLAAMGANPLDLGIICVEESDNRDVTVRAQRSGTGNNTWNNGSVLTASHVSTSVVAGTPSDANVVVTVPAAPVTDPAPGTSSGNKIGLPSDWQTVPNNTLSAAVTANVAVNAGTGTGSFQATVRFRLSGLGQTGVSMGNPVFGTLNRDGDLTVTAEISNTGDCASDTNQAPTADAGADQEGDEGSAIELDGSGSIDPDGDALTYKWSIDTTGIDANGECTFDDDTAEKPKVTCTDDSGDAADGVFTATLTVTDPGGLTDTDDVTVTVDNVDPVITAGSFTCPTDPVAVNTPVTLGGSFTDAGSNDTHDNTNTAYAWGDTTSSPGTVSESNGSGTVSGSHTYTAAGIFTPQLTVTDDDGGSDSQTCEYVVVYDPSAGFVTGGGWIWSPEGAYMADPTMVGKATFGFVSKYKKGATVPDGNTEFQFHAAGLNFKSTSYQWLVVSGSKATFKGYGTINGAGNYGFLLAARDGTPDKFRIKIWDVGTSEVVYDNNLGGGDDAEPATALGGGSIVIHTGGKK